MKDNKRPKLLYCDADGNVFDLPGHEPLFRSGNRFVKVDPSELIKLPLGSVIFSMPGRSPVYLNRKRNSVEKILSDQDMNAASAFISSGYLRTYLPGYLKNKDSEVLPLWAYAGVVLIGEDFYVPAIRIDDDPRSDHEIHGDRELLASSIAVVKKKLPENRLVRQLSKCSSEYNCLCASNFFIGRHEAPVPTSPSCNSACSGCLSFQEKDAGFEPSQQRLDFRPTPAEISAVILHHFNNVPDGVASFGQGCEGEPLLRGNDLADAISAVRSITRSGTINLNTNGSKPETVKSLIKSGLDSIRVSMNSPTEAYYNRYHRPADYSFADILRTIDVSLEAGIFVSINLFFMPGFTDMEREVEALFSFLNRYPVNMIQTRNLNIDPDYYFDSIGFRESKSIGIRNLIGMIRDKYPKIRLGYYNPPRHKY